MGRPLNKKYFGNTVAGGLGGERVASVTLDALGAYTTRPTFVFSDPTIPGGVTATGTITSEADTATVSGTQTAAYQVGQVLSIGTAGTTFTVATLAATATLTTVAITGTAGEFSCDAAALYVGQSLTLSGTWGGTGSVVGYTDPTTYYVKATTGTTFTLVNSYAAAISGTGGAIVTTVGTPTGITYTVNADAAPAATVTVAVRGTYESLVSGAQATTTVAGGAGALLTVTYRAKSVVIVNAGSGYTAAPTSTPTQSVTFASVVLSSTTQNAIAGSAFVTGGQNRTSIDIVKQTGSHRFLVKTVDGTGVCSLVTATPSAAGEMTIVATDSADGTYFVTKLTNRTARLVPGTGTQFASGAVVPWNLVTAVINVSVKVASN